MSKNKPFVLFFIIIVLILTSVLSLFLSSRDKPEDMYDNSAPFENSICDDCNVILITIDTLRADHLSSYGYMRATSPFIDSLAGMGVLFENAFSSTSHTAPSHASIFTSLELPQHNLLVNGQTLNDSIYTMVKMFNDEGYETAGFSSVRFLKGVSNGFNHFEFYDKSRKENANLSGYIPANLQIDRVIDWFKTLDDNKFFLWIHFFDVHDYKNGMPLEEFTDRIIKSDVENTIFLRFLFDNQFKGYNMTFESFENNKLLINRINTYDSKIMFVDSEIERLFEFMVDTDLNSNTIGIITADHGEGLENHDYFGHSRHIYNEQLHVPLIFFNNNIPGRISGLVRHVDIFPTLAQIIGHKLNINPEGNSLYNSIFLKKQPPMSFAFSHRRPKYVGHTLQNRIRLDFENGTIYSIQNLDFKYIFHSDYEDEFFDLRTDSLELNNLINSSSPEKDKIKRLLEITYKSLNSGDKVASTELNEEYVEELEALGYI